MTFEKDNTVIKRRKDKIFDDDSSQTSSPVKVLSDSNDTSNKENSLKKNYGIN